MRDNLQGTIETAFVFNTDLDFTELLQLIHEDLGLGIKDANKVKLLRELNEYLITQLKQSHIVSVLVDEAQNLSDDALEGLRLLSNLETDEEKLIQIVLMGQPELLAKLDRPTLRQLKQRVALQCRLFPLVSSEVGPYIEFRLRTAGYTGNDLFSPSAVRQITIDSRGIPRLVNVICDNGLLTAYARNQKNVSAKIIVDVVSYLRLGLEEQSTQAEIAPAITPTKPEPATIQYTAKDIPPAHILSFTSCLGFVGYKLRRILKVPLQSLAVILGLVALGSFISPKNYFEMAKRNLHEWVLLVKDQEPVPQQLVKGQEPVPQQLVKDQEPQEANPKVEMEPEKQRVIIPRGSSIYKIASETYGANTALGVDLIKEFNPEIKDLNRVFVGQPLLLPSLTPGTLLRKQPDGSYRLIARTFYRLPRAGEYVARLRNEGYQVTITPRKVTDNLLLYRVEIGGLKGFEEAHHTWLAMQ